MEIISNGDSLATLHRVKFTKDRERVSIPWFVAPNHDAQIFPLNVPFENRKYEKSSICNGGIQERLYHLLEI